MASAHGAGTFTTPRGIAQWAKKLYEGQAVSEAAVQLIVDGVPSRLGRDQKYGLGCMVRPTPQGLTYGHGGWFPGYLTARQTLSVFVRNQLRHLNRKSRLVSAPTGQISTTFAL